VAHQRLTLGAEPHGATLALEQAGTQGAFQLAHGVADSARRQLELHHGHAERAGTPCGFEGAQDGRRDVLDHLKDEPDSSKTVKKPVEPRFRCSDKA
jgi:hypothetical protein